MHLAPVCVRACVRACVCGVNAHALYNFLYSNCNENNHCLLRISVEELKMYVVINMFLLLSIIYVKHWYNALYMANVMLYSQ